MRDISIAASLSDQFTGPAGRVSQAARSTSNELKELRQHLRRINSERTRVDVDTELARRELAAARKELRGAKDDTEAVQAATERLGRASDNLSNLRTRYKELGNEVSDTYRKIRTAQQQAEKDANNPAPAPKSSLSLGSLLQMQGVSQLTSMLGQTASAGAQYLVQSSLGQRSARTASNVVSGAFSGASAGMMIGSAVAPGIGTAIGAVGGALIGAVSGGLQSAIQNAETDDEAFRSTVSELYTNVGTALTEKLTAGAATAASRETIAASYATLLGGEENANALLEQIQDFANATPYTYDELSSVGRILAAYGYGRDQIMGVLTAAGEASSAMGAGSAGMSTIATALGRMNAGKLDAETMETLTNIGVNGYQLIADRINRNGGDVDQAWVRQAISEGWFADGVGDYGTTQEFAQALIEEMAAVFGGSLEKQAGTTEGLQSTLGGLQDSLDAAMGEGYNEERNKGLQSQIDYLKGNSDQMEAIYSALGRREAELENTKEALARDIETSAPTGELVGLAKDMSEENQALLEELTGKINDALASGDDAALSSAWRGIQALKEAAWTNTDEYDEYVQAELDTIEYVQDATAGSYYTAGVALQDAQTRGYVDAARRNTSRILAANAEQEDAVRANGFYLPGQQRATAPGDSKSDMARAAMAAARGYATGLNRVPYNNFPALLHEGERVLTAREARNYGGRPSVTLNVSGNTIRGEADEDRLVRKIADQLQQAFLLAPA